MYISRLVCSNVNYVTDGFCDIKFNTLKTNNPFFLIKFVKTYTFYAKPNNISDE